jgi:asparagine synthase (glutamine-hydrolysing)
MKIMSVQFGRWNPDGKPIDREYLERAETLLTPYGPDDHGSYSKGSISIIYRAFHTTRESRDERQPYVMASGAVLTWDGRLDNRTELICELHDLVATKSPTDVEVVAAAYEGWGSGCCAKLIGDWALSVWDPRNRSLTLAKDPIGVRHLYYLSDDHQVTWSTILDALVLLSGRTFVLCEEYVAGWFSHFPANHLTPYIGIHAVLPSCSVLIKDGQIRIQKYWDFDPEKRTRYRSDSEYEEHFRTVFAQSVRRRLRSDRPILAELSGGMDSSSIVCMADQIIAEGSAETLRLDTVSYYDDSEPNWNERPYFTRVEEKRGRAGLHIDTSSQMKMAFELSADKVSVTPGSGCNSLEQFVGYLKSHGNRVLLSGIAGDEVTGGVPTPIPELANLLIKANFKHLAHALKVWALNKRRPWFHLLFETARCFLPPALVSIPKHRRPAPWLNPGFVRRNRTALHGYSNRLRILGSLPSFQENLSTLDALRRQLECSVLSSNPLYEKRYAFLDRDLLEFMYSIPREQIVRPGQRRSLMRRALVGIVPDELLNRKRKAFVARSALAALSHERIALTDLTKKMVSAELGIVVPEYLVAAIQKARQGMEIPVVTLMRTLGIETWLRNITANHLYE